MPRFENGATGLRVALKHELGTPRETPAGNRDVRIERDDGQIVETTADDQGMTEGFVSDVMHQVSITHLERLKKGEKS